VNKVMEEMNGNKLSSTGLIYRYRGVKEIGRLVNISEVDELTKIYLSAPSSFNDPYDSYYPEILKHSGVVRQEVENSICKRYNIQTPVSLTNGDSTTTAFDELHEFEREDHASKWNKWVESFSDYLQKNTADLNTGSIFWETKIKEEWRKRVKIWKRKKTNRLGIACFSECKDSVLMWSHYADMHKGICLEYDTNILSDFLLSHTHFRFNEVDYGKSKMSKTRLKEYGSALVDDCGIKLTNDMLYLIAYYKARCWSYEEEWRLVRILDDSESGKYDCSRYIHLKPRKILMGMNISTRNAEKVAIIASKLGIEYEYAKPKFN